MSLSPDEIERYKRHLLLREIGAQGQLALKKVSVVVIGAGGLGSPILAYLAAAGVGRLTICDGDTVDRSNLQRQILFRTEDIGRPKADVTAAALRALNPEIEVTARGEHLTAENADDICAGHDLIVEGLDRFAPRYVVNAASLRLNIPLLSVAIGRFDGQIAALNDGPDAPCYRCFVPEAADDEAICETQGVLGAVPGVMGSLAALETIKRLTGMDNALQSQLLIFEGSIGTLRRVKINKDPSCPDCA